LPVVQSDDLPAPLRVSLLELMTAVVNAGLHAPQDAAVLRVVLRLAVRNARLGAARSPDIDEALGALLLPLSQASRYSAAQWHDAVALFASVAMPHAPALLATSCASLEASLGRLVAAAVQARAAHLAGDAEALFTAVLELPRVCEWLHPCAVRVAEAHPGAVAAAASTAALALSGDAGNVALALSPADFPVRRARESKSLAEAMCDALLAVALRRADDATSTQRSTQLRAVVLSLATTLRLRDGPSGVQSVVEHLVATTVSFLESDFMRDPATPAAQLLLVLQCVQAVVEHVPWAHLGQLSERWRQLLLYRRGVFGFSGSEPADVTVVQHVMALCVSLVPFAAPLAASAAALTKSLHSVCSERAFASRDSLPHFDDMALSVAFLVRVTLTGTLHSHSRHVSAWSVSGALVGVLR
jgi:hypothetical protein